MASRLGNLNVTAPTVNTGRGGSLSDQFLQAGGLLGDIQKQREQELYRQQILADQQAQNAVQNQMAQEKLLLAQSANARDADKLGLAQAADTRAGKLMEHTLGAPGRQASQLQASAEILGEVGKPSYKTVTGPTEVGSLFGSPQEVNESLLSAKSAVTAERPKIVEEERKKGGTQKEILGRANVRVQGMLESLMTPRDMMAAQEIGEGVVGEKKVTPAISKQLEGINKAIKETDPSDTNRILGLSQARDSLLESKKAGDKILGKHLDTMTKFNNDKELIKLRAKYNQTDPSKKAKVMADIRKQAYDIAEDRNWWLDPSQSDVEDILSEFLTSKE